MTIAPGRSRIPAKAFTPRAFVEELDALIEYHERCIAIMTLKRAAIIAAHADADTTVDNAQRCE